MLVNALYRTETGTGRVPSTGALTEWYEQDVVARAKSRSETAFDELVRHYERRVFRLAQNITRNHEDAEEAVQNAFLKAFQNLVGFRGDSRFYTWLVRITVNEALMKIRRRPRHKEVSIDESEEADDSCIPPEIEDWGPNPEQRYSQQELQNILATTINELKPGYRTVFQLRYVDGLSTEETAQALALSSSAVKTRLRRARITLRNSLGKYFLSASATGNQVLVPRGIQRLSHQAPRRDAGNGVFMRKDGIAHFAPSSPRTIREGIQKREVQAMDRHWV